jgi:hypothetical protein
VVALSFVIPTRISCHAALDKIALRLSLKERRMKSVNATKFHRKSGGAKPRDLQSASTPLGIPMEPHPLPLGKIILTCTSTLVHYSSA